MRTQIVKSCFVATCLAGLLGLPNAASASTEVIASRLPNPVPGLQSYAISAVSDGALITAIQSLELIGEVHQVNRFGTMPSLFLDQLPSNLLLYDTHMMLNSSEVELAGSPLAETNDGSNPVGLSEPTYAFGLGSFGQPGGGMMILPPYQSSSLEFLQVVFPQTSYLEIHGTILDGTPNDFSLVLPVLPSAQVVAWPDPLDFGPTRVGTVATATASAWIDSDETIESVAGSYIAKNPIFGPTVFTNCVLSSEQTSDIPFTFSPTSRGGIYASADVNAEGGIVSAYLTLFGTGVGPVFGAGQTPCTTVEFGRLPVDSFFDVFFELANVTSDPELGSLTSLGIDAAIESDSAGAFAVMGDDAFELLVGQADQVTLRFDSTGLAPGEYAAQLVLHTDVGAAAGATAAGATYAFTLHAWVNVPGDANGDGRVDDDDAKALATNWGKGGGWAQGDFNDDGVVNALDATILAANWGYDGTVEQTGRSTAVPEPGVVALLAGIALNMLIHGRWRRDER